MNPATSSLGGTLRFRSQVVEGVAVNAAIAALGLLTGVLQARSLGPEGRGELAAIQLWAGLISTFGMMGMYEAVIFFGSKDRDRVGQYSASATGVVFAIGAVLVAATWALLPALLSAQSTATVETARAYLGLFFALALLNIPIFIARAMQRTRLWNALRILPTVVWVIVILVETGRGTATPGRLAITYLACLGAVAVVSLASVREQLRGALPPRPEHFGPMMRYGAPLALSTVPLLANQRVDQLLLAGFLPAAQLGYYAVGLALSNVALLVPSVLALVAFPRIAALTSPAAQSAFAARLVVATGTVVFVLALLLGFAGPRLLPALFGAGFEPAASISAILLAGTPFRGIAQVVHGSAKGMGHPSAVMLSEASGLAVGGVGMVFLLPRFGVLGVAAAGSFASVVTCLVSLWLLYRRTLSAHRVNAPGTGAASPSRRQARHGAA